MSRVIKFRSRKNRRVGESAEQPELGALPKKWAQAGAVQVREDNLLSVKERRMSRINIWECRKKSEKRSSPMSETGLGAKGTFCG